jgi:hypothetical protein
MSYQALCYLPGSAILLGVYKLTLLTIRFLVVGLAVRFVGLLFIEL